MIIPSQTYAHPWPPGARRCQATTTGELQPHHAHTYHRAHDVCISVAIFLGGDHLYDDETKRGSHRQHTANVSAADRVLLEAVVTVCDVESNQ